MILDNIKDVTFVPNVVMIIPIESPRNKTKKNKGDTLFQLIVFNKLVQLMSQMTSFNVIPIFVAFLTSLISELIL